MLANMVSSLFTNGQIQTTLVKAKEARRFAEKLITIGKKGEAKKAEAKLEEVAAETVKAEEAKAEELKPEVKAEEAEAKAMEAPKAE